MTKHLFKKIYAKTQKEKSMVLEPKTPCTKMFLTVLFVTAKDQKQSKFYQ